MRMPAAATATAIPISAASDRPPAACSASPRTGPRNMGMRPEVADSPSSPPNTAPAASRDIGSVISNGDSCASPSRRLGPKNVSTVARVAYSAVNPDVTRAVTHKGVRPDSYADAGIWSLLKKPAARGTPASANPPMTNVIVVTGSFRHRPPRRFRSISPWVACITLPAPRNITALKNACVTRWKMATAYAPTPAARNIRPSWLIVEYARTRFRSSWPSAEVAAYRAVTLPTTATTNSACGDASNSECVRTTRYTPAVTIVAAWLSAETGVGPSIASGSHVCSGICAGLPTAPAKSRSETRVAVPEAIAPAEPNTSSNSTDPVVTKIRKIPISIAVSPMRVTMNAFFPASAAAFRSCQKAISRYEQRPTPSQPTYSNAKLFARTSESIEKTNRLRYAKYRGYRGSPRM